MVCVGCHSEDRILTIVDNELLKVYLGFIDNITEYRHDVIQLCWECKALLRKFQRFRDQVRHAYSIAVTCLVSQSKSLSNLRITECNSIIKVDHDSEVLPTTFVKIEVEPHADSADVFDDLGDGESVGDGLNDDLDDFVKLNDDKVDIKPDPILESEATSKSVKQNETTDTFNDSDDEPLKCDSTKPRGKRKRKIDDVPKGRPAKRPGVVNNAKVQNKLQRLNVDADHLEKVVLSWEEVEEERRKALASPAFLRHQHRCYSCVVGFNHRCKLDDHNAKKHDPSLGTVQCGVCHVRLRNVFGLRAHQRRHVASCLVGCHRWRCRVCGAVWSRAEVAADHVARAHGGNTPVHTCHVCGARETVIARHYLDRSLGRLRYHVNSHAEQQKCELCGKTFKSKESLRTHLFIHKGEKEHACPSCGKKFLFKKAMEIHAISHLDSAQLYCYECDMNFKNQMSFNQHMKYSLKHVDPAKLKHACSLCDKRFVKAVRLEEHKLAVHLKVTPISCAEPDCQFACSSKPVLRTHVRMTHRNARARRDHVCDVCGKAYATKKSLEGHLRTHSGERPYRCAACPAAFGYHAALYNHNKLVHLKLKTGRGRGAEWPSARPPAPVDNAS
ncbi:zinc finger protein 250 isoform X4 [Bicyclus anynana]|uniref:Zinc finger protein 250 isoform X4 n=1 Tax=Bicyclus anynana TaxID=110368 RepID=A0ABM3M3K3_BICAN|nr:zinc finger protein 250 isoform X4 [Bicyclus anynana]